MEEDYDNIDGRPAVYTIPTDAYRNVSSGKRRLIITYGRKDRLLLALRRAHGEPRYDLVDYGR